MATDGEVEAVLARYCLQTRLEMITEIPATHRAFRVTAGGRDYALRQFNPYMTSEDLTQQCLLASSMAAAGLRTPVPVPADDGRAFVEVRGRLWALFPWCHGRPGSPERLDDLFSLVDAQASWVTCSSQLRRGPHWEPIAATARRFRQRKDWAWVVPLDRLPSFAREVAIPQVSADLQRSPVAAALRALLPDLLAASAALEERLEDLSASRLPHMISHGDFWASNICISDEGTTVLDLDCFSYEPRVADFARSAHWYYTKRAQHENAALSRRFRTAAGVSGVEMQPLPVFFSAHDLYYLIGGAVRFSGESAAEQVEIVEGIRTGLARLRDYDRIREEVQHTFCSGD